jgi:hypothetical protein
MDTKDELLPITQTYTLLVILPYPAANFSPRGAEWDGILRKSLGDPYEGMQTIKRATCPLRKFTRERARASASWDHSCGYEALCLGRAGAGSPDQVCGVDQRVAFISGRPETEGIGATEYSTTRVELRLNNSEG